LSEVLKIPESEAELREQLGSLGQLLVAVTWQKAALVTAYQLATGETAAQIARLNIRGLKSTSAVKQSLDAWASAVEFGAAKPIVLGEEVELPKDELWDELAPEPDVTRASRVGGEENLAKYRKEAEALGTTVGMAVRVGQSPAAVMAAILADPKMADIAREALDERRKRQQIISDPLPPSRDQFTRLMLDLRGAKASLDASLGAAMHLNGTQWRGKREVVGALAGEVAEVANAIGQVARGESIEQGLERLLSGGPE